MSEPKDIEILPFAKEANGFFDKLYSHFLHRDLVFISSGLVIVMTLAIITGHLNIIVSLPTWILIFLVVSCYYIGLMNQEFWVWIGVFKYYPNQNRKAFAGMESANLTKLMKGIDVKSVSGSWKIVERIIVVKHIAIGVGGSILTSGLISLVWLLFNLNEWSNSYCYFIVPLTVFLAISIRVNHDKTEVQNNILNAIIEEQESKKAEIYSTPYSPRLRQDYREA